MNSHKTGETSLPLAPETGDGQGTPPGPATDATAQKAGPAPERVRETIEVYLAFVCAIVCGAAVNYLMKYAPKGYPVALNGWRTLLAGAIVLLPALWLIPRREFAISWREAVWYVVLAALTMAVPHALIIVGLQVREVPVAAAAFIEAAVVGIVFVYLLTGGKKIDLWSVLACVLTLVGLALFLKVESNQFQISVGDFLILLAAIATGAGFIVADRLEPSAPGFPAKRRKSVKKTLFTCFLSGGGTLLVLAAVGTARGDGLPPVPPASAFPWVLALAVVGNILTWYSVFLLIATNRLLLAAAVLPGIAALTMAVNLIWFPGENPDPTSTLQWVGGLTILFSFAALCWFQRKPLQSS